MFYPKFFKRLVSSLIIGGQAIAATARGRINRLDLFDQLLEALAEDENFMVED